MRNTEKWSKNEFPQKRNITEKEKKLMQNLHNKKVKQKIFMHPLKTSLHQYAYSSFLFPDKEK